MASFARSFKPPPALLSPRCRPGMASRTLSSSSEFSLTPNTVTAHQTDYFVDRPVKSAPNTPLSPTVGPVLEEGSQLTAGELSPCHRSWLGIFYLFFDYFRPSTGAQCLSPSPIFVLALSSSNYSRLSHSHHTCCTTAAIYHTSMTVSHQCAIKFGSGYGAAKTRKTNDNSSAAGLCG